MHRSSETIGAIATALAKAQIELSNPEKTLTGTIPMRGGERVFRYASLASGLDLVRKCLGQHEIALIQTTAVDGEQIMLTTLLVHASGEWVSSLWPVCAAAEPSAHIKGAALTYARRYALFTLVGIAGEDDLDAPEPFQAPQPPGSEPLVKANSGRMQSSRPPTLTSKESTILRDRLIEEIPAVSTEKALALWAHRSLPLKNTLVEADAQAVEMAYLTQLTACSDTLVSAEASPASAPQSEERPEVAAAIAIPKTLRKRNKAHLAFVASQACLICRVTPCDAHHLKITQPRSLGRKVSDEFTVPLCRQHHRELHRHGNEANWWANMQVAPIPVAKELWEQSQVHDASKRWGG
jgi:ERF superfamily